MAVLLGYSNTKDAVIRHCKNAQALSSFVGGSDSRPLNFEGVENIDPQTKLIPESDIWRLIIKSKLPEAEKIEKWIFEDVLPEIRKTGSYSIQPKTEPIQQTKLSELQEIVELYSVFEKLQTLTKGKSKLEILKFDNFLKSQNRKSILEILNLDFSNSYFSVSEIGEYFGKSGSEINQDLAKIGFQILENGVWEVLENGKESCFETNNQFSQLKWKFEVLERI